MFTLSAQTAAVSDASALQGDGVSELFWSERYGQHFHDRSDPVRQSRQVYLVGSRTDRQVSPRVLEVGFGLGLNFRTTLSDCLQRGAPLEYLALEHDPQPVARLSANAEHTGQATLAAWQELLQQWPVAPCRISRPEVTLEVRIEDAVIALLPRDWASAIYLDGFSSAVNAELWSDEFIAKLAQSLAPGGWLATYSAAGHVRRALQAAGLKVERGAGWGSKWECLRAQRAPQDE